MPTRIYILASLLLLLFWGCRGWDDDSEYESRTRAAYFLCDQAGTGLNSVHKYSNGGLEMGWNQRFGIPDGEVGQLSSSSSSIWLSSGSQGRVLEIDPSEDATLQEINLPHRADYFAVGEREIMVVDTAANHHSFYNLRSGDLLTLELGGNNGPVLYNSSNFYFRTDISTIQVIDEMAYTPRTSGTVTRPIVDMRFNRFKNVFLQTADSAGNYFVFLSGVDGGLVSEEAAVNYQQVRHTPYLEARFGSEWVEDVRLENNRLVTGGQVLPDSASGFEVDFFEADLYYQWEDSLYKLDLETNTVTDRLFFDWDLRSSAYWLGRE